MSFRNLKNSLRNMRPLPVRLTYAYFLCLLCSVFIISSCATDEIGKMQYDLNMLKADVRNIKKKSKSIESEIPGQKKQLDKKIRKLEGTQTATAKTVSDLLIKIQSFTTEFQLMTGRLDETSYFSEKTSADLSESNNSILERLQKMESAIEELKKKLQATETVKSPTEQEGTTTAGESTTTPSEDKSGAKELYMAAYEAYKNEKPQEARDKFTSLLNDFPENDFSDNARFWIGESYYKDGKYEDAILAYEELFRKNPESDKVPGAMLKQGLAFYSLKDKKTGKIIMEKLIEKYPGSEQAKLAAKKIKKTVLPEKNK